MKTLRYLHLYLGCLFAPMLVFFAVSGIWQTFRLQSTRTGLSLLTDLSTIHTGAATKIGGSWSSPLMKWFVVIAAVGFVLSVVLGVMMAYRYGRMKTASLALAAGVVVPVGLVLFARP